MIKSLSSSLNVVLNKTRTLGWESYQLASALVVNRRDPFQSVLVSQARNENNTVATSLLKMHQQLGLVRYYGVLGYLEKERGINLFKHHSSRRFISNDNNNDHAKESKPQRARVAFMITATQRVELAERLGFDQDQIKRLTPVQANLVLKHDLHANHEEFTTVLQELEIKQQQQLLIQQQQQERESQKDGLAPPPAQQLDETVTTDASTATTMDASSDKESPAFDTASLSEAPKDSASKTSTIHDSKATTTTDDSIQQEKIWYEIVETFGEHSSVIALYKDKEEAQLCLETKQEFAERRAKEGQTHATFELRHRKEQ